MVALGELEAPLEKPEWPICKEWPICNPGPSEAGAGSRETAPSSTLLVLVGAPGTPIRAHHTGPDRQGTEDHFFPPYTLSRDLLPPPARSTGHTTQGTPHRAHHGPNRRGHVRSTGHTTP